jgi:penicillin-binding protein 1C
MQIGMFLSKLYFKLISACRATFVSKWRKRHLAGLVLTVFALVLIGVWTSVKVRTFTEVKKSYKPSDVWIVDRNGYPLESIRTRDVNRSLDWVKWEEVSPTFRELLINVEDRRFYSHSGVDLLAFSKAALERITGQSRRGASTLTMQLAGLAKNENLGRGRTLKQKLVQILSALKINSGWTKDEVVEAYVNLVSFRGELVGLRAASLGYFAKNPSGLVTEEAALLIALLRSPNASKELVAKRACLILKSTDCQQINALAEQTFSRGYRLSRSRELVPVVSKYFTDGSEGSSVIQTSLDHQVQEMAMSALREQLRVLKKQNVNDGAVLVLDSQTGKVLAYAANAGAKVASAEQVDGIQSRRQAGSTIKPFVYATAFDWRLLRANSLLDDSPADISISQGRVYHPKNYDLVFRGPVSVGDALGSSMNVPAVRALQLVGEPRILDRLHALGFEELQQDEYYGPSLALGAIDVTLWELTQGYRQFAVSNSTFSEPTRLSIFNILAAPEHRRFTFGMDSLLTLPFPAAVKTGTSKDMRDNWCIGWTSQFTVGVWIGNFNGEPMWNVSGMSGAAPIWRSLMLALHPNPKSELTTYEAPAAPLPRQTISRIRYPAPDMLVGLDPDIPVQLQKLPIEIENPQRGHKIYLNNRLLSQSKETTLWPLQRGKYRVELKSQEGESLDSVRFEVR